MERRIGTATSAFGSVRRTSHDSSQFYESRLYEGLPRGQRVKYVENKIPEKYVNHVFCKSSQTMEELPDCSVHLMITSPPYNVTKEYDGNLNLTEYRQLLKDVFRETYRVLVPGGRACINVANLGRKPCIPLHSYIIKDMLDIGFLMRGEIIWNKASSAAPSTAWGSWVSAANAVLRDIHEYILVFSKDSFTRVQKGKESTIKKSEFLEWTKSVWTFPAASAQRVGHPAPFPLELPRRLIQLYSFKWDIVLDPFAGSGTTCLSALRDKRHYVAYDSSRAYVQLAKQRISSLKNGMKA